MESQMHRPNSEQENTQHAVDSHSVIEGQIEAGQHAGDEKKSVLKKVKDKAKKIKDTIKKHGGLGQEHEDDEELNTNPAVHGAQTHEQQQPAVIMGTNLPMQTGGFNLEKPSEYDTRECYQPTQAGGFNLEKPSEYGTRETNHPEKTGFNLEKPTDTREDRYDSTTDVKDEQYTSLREKGVSPPRDMETEFEGSKLKTVDEPENKNIIPPISNKPDSIDVREVHVSQPAAKPDQHVLEEDPHSPGNRREGMPPSNYQTKVSDPTGRGGNEAEVGSLIQGLHNVRVSGESNKSLPQEQEQLSKSYTGSHDQFTPQSTPTEEIFIPESNPKPDDEPKSYNPDHPESMPRDTIGGKISSASSVIVDKAASAKNVVASKLGYGSQPQEESSDTHHAAPKKPLTEPATEYKNMVAEKLNPVYEKVAGAGSAVLSKVQGSGSTGQQREGGTEVSKGGPDKGVSVKEYLSEKFRPGDEDKALSEAILKKLKVSKKQPPVGDDRNVEATRKESKIGNSGLGGGVVDSLKGVVGSWLGNKSGTDQSHGSDGGGKEVAAQKEEAANMEQKMNQ